MKALRTPTPAWSNRLFLLLILALSATLPAISAAKDNTPSDPNNISPIMIGQTLPPIKLDTMEGKQLELTEKIHGNHALLIFYRGGWCPYCNTHLSELRKIEQDLKDLGFGIYAISPDQPAMLKESVGKHKMGYTLLSDSSMNAAKALGLAFEVDKKTRKKYKEYGIDLERSSGKSHHLLPVPAAILVNPDGIVTFTFISPNYKIRVSNNVIMAAARDQINNNDE